MKKYILSFILNNILICLLSLNVSGQITFDGHVYEPMPLPEGVIKSSKDRQSDDHYFIQYDVSEKSTTIISTQSNNQETGRNFSASRLEGNIVEEPTSENRIFSELSYYGNETDYPQSTTVKLFMKFTNDYYPYEISYSQCSGTLIGDRFVLTAGHCMHNNEYGWADEIIVVPSYENGVEPYGRAYGISFMSWNGWLEDEDWDWDMGLIVLDRSIGNCTGWLGLMYENDNNFFLNSMFRNLSYPADNPYDGQWMYYQYGWYDEVSTHIIANYNNSYGGMSGSGHYYKNDSGDRYVAGVLSHGSPGYTGNVRVDQTKFEHIVDEMSNWGEGINCNGTNSVATENIEFTDLEIFPNPVRDIINIKSDQIDKANTDIQIIDATGNIVRTLPFEEIINVSDLAHGFYVLIISTPEGFISRKIVVSN